MSFDGEILLFVGLVGSLNTIAFDFRDKSWVIVDRKELFVTMILVLYTESGFLAGVTMLIESLLRRRECVQGCVVTVCYCYECVVTNGLWLSCDAQSGKAHSGRPLPRHGKFWTRFTQRRRWVDSDDNLYSPQLSTFWARFWLQTPCSLPIYLGIPSVGP